MIAEQSFRIAYMFFTARSCFFRPKMDGPVFRAAMATTIQKSYDAQRMENQELLIKPSYDFAGSTHADIALASNNRIVEGKRFSRVVKSKGRTVNTQILQSR